MGGLARCTNLSESIEIDGFFFTKKTELCKVHEGHLPYVALYIHESNLSRALWPVTSH